MASGAEKPELERKIAVIVERYRRDLPERIAELRRHWQDLCATSEPAPVMEQMFRAAHTLKGSAATLGFPEVSVEAARIDAGMRPLMEQHRTPDPVECQHIEAVLERLERLAASPEVGSLPASATGSAPTSDAAHPQQVLLVQSGHGALDELAAQIGHYGFEVVLARGTEAATAACDDRVPLAVVIDLEQGREADGLVIGRALMQRKEMRVIYLGGRSDVRCRLEAVRSGAASYLLKPVSVATLVDALDRVTEADRVEPYRVLIVEDSGFLGAFYSVTLEHGGMRTRVLREPVQLLDAMAEFNPELVLMDMYLPDYTGAELASLIRQESTYVGVPIVYLSSETDLHKQLQAMSQGGDDFLTKPITPEHLLSAVRSRAARYRALRRMMVRDSLTGLLNHSRTKEQLAVEFMRAQRQNLPLAFAMLDIDHFKAVNDTYGHAVGDRVIQSLARLLRQRLRSTDVVGRYGGEEFAVVLENAAPDDAQRIMEDLRTRFGALRHQADGREFQVTLSCGVACFPRYDDVNALSEAADRALYRAKRNGRDQVQVDC